MPTTYEDGGDVTFCVHVTVSVFATNPEFNRDDMIEHATAILGYIEDEAQQRYPGVSFSKPYEVTSVTA